MYRFAFRFNRRKEIKCGGDEATGVSSYVVFMRTPSGAIFLTIQGSYVTSDKMLVLN